jgi:hypothetical protein
MLDDLGDDPGTAAGSGIRGSARSVRQLMSQAEGDTSPGLRVLLRTIRPEV